MTYFQNTTDASGLYRPSSAAGSDNTAGTALQGNLADFMKNGSVVRVTLISTPQIQVTDIQPSTVFTDSFGAL